MQINTRIDESSMLYAVRGVGITLVVFAHVLSGRISEFVYVFHMPLFFLLAGIVFSEFSNNTFKKLSERVIQLISATAFAVFVVIAIVFLNPYCLLLGGNFLHSCARFSFGLGGLSGVFSAYWFIPAIVICYLFHFSLSNSIWLHFPVSFGFFIFALTILVVAGFLPSIFISALYGFQFFAIGTVLSLKLIRRVPLFFSVFIFLLFFTGFRWLGLSLDMAAKDFGLPLISVVVALLISVSVIRLVCAFSFFNAFLRLFSIIGRSSVFVLFYHQACHLFFVYYFPDVAKFFVFLFSLSIPVIVYVLVPKSNSYLRYLGVR